MNTLVLTLYIFIRVAHFFTVTNNAIFCTKLVYLKCMFSIEEILFLYSTNNLVIFLKFVSEIIIYEYSVKTYSCLVESR